MTATDRPATHLEGQHDVPQHAEPAAVEDTFLDYAAAEFSALAAQTTRMPMDVSIAATIGLGYEVRRLADAIERMEKLIADPTAVLRAAQAQAQQALFPLEEAEAAELAAAEMTDTAAPRSAASG